MVRQQAAHDVDPPLSETASYIKNEMSKEGYCHLLAVGTILQPVSGRHIMSDGHLHTELPLKAWHMHMQNSRMLNIYMLIVSYQAWHMLHFMMGLTWRALFMVSSSKFGVHLWCLIHILMLWSMCRVCGWSGRGQQAEQSVWWSSQ